MLTTNIPTFYQLINYLENWSSLYNANFQVWAAGFSAALLKKRSSLISSSDENNGVAKQDMKMNGTGTKDNSSSFAEILTLSLLEKFFTLVLMLPDVNQ